MELQKESGADSSTYAKASGVQSQNGRILTYLKEGHTITHFDALKGFDCARLASRINDLRNQGHEIVTVHEFTRTGKRIARYKLQK